MVSNTKKMRILLFIILSVICNISKAQIGLSRARLVSADTMYVECIEARDYIYVDFGHSDMAFFNMTDGVCLDATVFCRPGDAFLETFVGRFKAGLEYGCSLTYIGGMCVYRLISLKPEDAERLADKR